MKRTLLAPAVFLCFAASLSNAQTPPKPDTRSDALRTESVKAPPKPTSSLRLNINSASATELMKLPGLSDAQARAIVKARPYKSKEDLLKRKLLSQAQYEELKSNFYAGR
ncbi:MAG TPA: helix-hairpin-helix domain-containing protein [Usitatibacter sp.]|nr:helix-hairpin-helix domain-containing protein [Usitatibacter sp.]